MTDLDEEIAVLCKRVTTWDQAELDGLLGQPAINYARNHEADVRRLAHLAWQVFPLGPRWWRVTRALRNVFAKNDAIRKRAAEIGQGRKDGSIVVRGGRLVRR